MDDWSQWSGSDLIQSNAKGSEFERYDSLGDLIELRMQGVDGSIQWRI